MSVNDPDNRSLKRVTYSGMLINLILGIVKVITGLIGNSQAALADGIHSFSDLATDLAIIIGVKFWSKPPDEDHPYGHARIETIVTLFIGILLMSAGFGIGIDSITSIRDEHIASPGGITLSGIILSIILKETLFRWTISVGKKINSSSVIANAWHHRSDAFSSLIAMISVLTAILFPGLEFIDHIGAMLVSFIIIKASWDIMKPAMSELIDSGVSQKDEELIKKIAMDINGVKEVHAVRGRRYNSGNIIDLHVLVDGNISVIEGHVIAEQVTENLLTEGPSVIDVVVHIEPFETERTN